MKRMITALALAASVPAVAQTPAAAPAGTTTPVDYAADASWL